MSKTAVKSKQARKRAEKRNKRSKRSRNKTKPQPKSSYLTVIGDDPMSGEYWALYQRGLSVANQVIQELGSDNLEDMKARSIEVSVNVERDLYSTVISYEEPFEKNGRLASLSVGITEIELGIYNVAFFTAHAVNPGEEPIPHTFHRTTTIVGMDGLFSEMMVGTMVSSRIELQPDLPPLQVIEL